MTDSELGRAIRTVRIRLGLRQVDVARLARASQASVSAIERGRLAAVSVAMLRRVTDALGARLDLRLRWNGGEVDRLLDRGHAALVETLVEILRKAGWDVRVEAAFNHFGDRGSVDILAWHAASRTLLIVEVKTLLADLQALFRSMAVKARVVPAIVAEEEGWVVEHVATVLFVAGSAANRNVVSRHRESFDVTFPARTAALRAWIAAPVGAALSGIWFADPARTRTTTRQRVRRRVRRAADVARSPRAT